ncbi:bromodomain-containing protein [Chloropicon primus]|uniref:Bromodomain-containing protein n=1 Tax=Chloropicon primus TaxID=1764295 RepID=A0A5B8MF03_9CHLO|nr:bromodomain-containing protein [Chloropicon primus]|mmetsp:Transcript_3772/g.10836  ORF Transcript_3772/g.10836 Transcript_3772/m.10836 type:complete len:393 (+) Transcript_3772:240-1418(+)|eukprot:QDZ18861.1 bromodomain-containing protein [Chloropicon primus]
MVDDAKVKRLCEEADREWRKNIKRKICDASVVTDQIAERAIKLLRDQNVRLATSKSSTPAVALVDEAGMEKMANDKGICAVAEKRLAILANKATLLILERLMSHKWAWLFNEPVNAEELNLKDYHTIVKKPMALSTVKNRAQLGLYKTATEAASDIRLVFENAQLYNKPGSDVNIMASAMLEKFEELWHSKVTQKFNEDEAMAKQEESVARKKRVDALKAQQNGVFRQKCLSYERLLCDVESYLVDVQQQVIVSCKPVAREKRKRAQDLLQTLPFEKVKPALGVVLQRYPEMLNTSTQEMEVDLNKVDPLTLRHVLLLLSKAEKEDAKREGMEGTPVEEDDGAVKDDLRAWVNTMCKLVKLKHGDVGDNKNLARGEEGRKGPLEGSRLNITT